MHPHKRSTTEHIIRSMQDRSAYMRDHYRALLAADDVTVEQGLSEMVLQHMVMDHYRSKLTAAGVEWKPTDNFFLLHKLVQTLK